MFLLENNHEISVLCLICKLEIFCGIFLCILHGVTSPFFFFLKSFLSFYCLLKPTGHIIFQDEIFDMVKPEDPYKITLQDLVNRSGKN